MTTVGGNNGYNPDSRDAKGLTMGFQKTVAGSVGAPRNFIRLAFNGAGGSVEYEPTAAALHNFKPNAVVACLQHAIVNRAGTGPVIVTLDAYQTNTLALAPLGQGPSYTQDNAVAVVAPNTAVSMQPSPDSAGAQFQTSNLLGGRIRLNLYDATAKILTDVTSFYISLILFEKL